MVRTMVERIGEDRIMSNGLMATIIEYRTGKNIDVEFENGQISRHKSYGDFLLGHIKCPMIFEMNGNIVTGRNPNTGNQPFTFDLEFWDAVVGKWWSVDPLGYVTGGGKPLKKLHRMVIAAETGREVDHIDGNPSNNCLSNLRLCDRAGNNRNQRIRKDNTSGFKGVCWHKVTGKWAATIMADKMARHIGLFSTPEEAAAAYNEMAIKYHGEFAKLNAV